MLLLRLLLQYSGNCLWVFFFTYVAVKHVLESSTDGHRFLSEPHGHPYDVVADIRASDQHIIELDHLVTLGLKMK